MPVHDSFCMCSELCHFGPILDGLRNSSFFDLFVIHITAGIEVVGLHVPVEIGYRVKPSIRVSVCTRTDAYVCVAYRRMFIRVLRMRDATLFEYMTLFE